MSAQETLNKFNDLYENTYNDVSKYVVCKCSRLEDVEDIIQIIYTDVFKKITEGKKMDIAYIIGISKNKVKDYYRFDYKQKIISLFSSKEGLEVIDKIPSDIDIEKTITQKYDTELIWKYLKKKKIIISKIFYLYYSLGLSIKEISTCLNISESNVKHYLYRTLKEIKSYMERKED